MRPCFSEFSYGFAVVHELMSNLANGYRAFPVFPSLQQEASLGYDVNLDHPVEPLFLQFKVAEYMKRSSAREILHFDTDLSPGLYRFWIRAANGSQQHKLLCDLANAGNTVFYVSPRFHTTHELSTHFQWSCVVDFSALVDPQAIGSLPDGESHTISYCLQASHAWLCSEPRKIEIVKPAELATKLRQSLTDPDRHPGRERLASFLHQTVDIFQKREVAEDWLGPLLDLPPIETLRGQPDEFLRTYLRQVGKISTNRFETALVVVQSL